MQFIITIKAELLLDVVINCLSNGSCNSEPFIHYYFKPVPLEFMFTKMCLHTVAGEMWR